VVDEVWPTCSSAWAFPESDGVTLDDLKGYLGEIAEHCEVVSDWVDHQQIKKRGKQWCPPLDGPDVLIDQRSQSRCGAVTYVLRQGEL
jgi:hypothetical protein